MSSYIAIFSALTVQSVASYSYAQQCSYLTAQSPSFDDLYGHEVVSGGGQLFVTAPFEDDDLLGVDSGAVYVYEIVNGELKLVQHIQPPEPSRRDWFGSSVAVDSDTLVIGASGDDDHQRGSGSVFVYRRVDDEWKFNTKLLAYDGGFNDNFGASLALDGSMLVVGAPGFDGVAEATGKAYLFDVTTGLLLNEFVGDDTSARDGFGRTITIGDGLLFVGVPSWDTVGADTTGAVYIFDLISGKQTARVTSDREHVDQAFGRSVAYADGQLLVGAPGETLVYDDGQYQGRVGAVYRYRLEDGALIAIDIIRPSDVEQYDSFGTDIALKDGIALISSPGLTSCCSDTNGKAYLFDSNADLFIEHYEPQGPFNRSAMGSQVVLFENLVVMASELANSPGVVFGGSPSGAGVVFDRGLYDCLANINNDCEVDIQDIIAFQSAFVANDQAADINRDHHIDFFDASLFLQSYLDGCD